MRSRSGDGLSRDDKLAAVHETLVAAVDELAHSDAWMRMLAVAAKFPTYSPSNVLLIATAMPTASRVCGYRTWAALGRHVRKGQHGIAILAPCVYKSSPANDRAPDAPEAARNPADAPPTSDDDRPARQLRGFKIVHVFDISQTDGEPLPDVAPELLRGPAPTELWDRIVALVEADGYAVERGRCHGMNGYTDFDQKVIRVRDDVEPAQAIKTLLHEVGHVRGGHDQRLQNYFTDLRCRGIVDRHVR